MAEAAARVHPGCNPCAPGPQPLCTGLQPHVHSGCNPCAPQARALGRMLAIDDGAVGFTEEEMSDHALASGIGWTLKVKATRLTPTP
mgnify:CR=1 FL=1|jgi:hypothetical protein